MLDPFACNLPHSATFRWQWGQARYPTQNYYGQLNYITSGEFTPGVVAYEAWLGFVGGLTPWFGYLAEGTALTSQTSLTVTTATRTYLASFPLDTGGYGYANYVPNQLCFVTSLWSTGPGRAGRGIFRSSADPWALLQGDYVPASFRDAWNIYSTAFLTSFDVHGVTFTPAVWSRRHNALWPINRVTLSARISRLHKRRAARRKQNAWIPVTNTGWPAP